MKTCAGAGASRRAIRPLALGALVRHGMSGWGRSPAAARWEKDSLAMARWERALATAR